MPARTAVLTYGRGFESATLHSGSRPDSLMMNSAYLANSATRTGVSIFGRASL
jgi:hypothetical protein